MRYTEIPESNKTCAQLEFIREAINKGNYNGRRMKNGETRVRDGRINRMNGFESSNDRE